VSHNIPPNRKRVRKQTDPTRQRVLSKRLTKGAFMREAQFELSASAHYLLKNATTKHRERAEQISSMYDEYI